MKKLILSLGLIGSLAVCSMAGIVHRADKVITSTITTNVSRDALYIDTNTYTVGYSSASSFYGDGANVTDVDAQTLDSYNYDYFLGTTTAASTYLDLSSASATYLQQSSATSTYLQNSSATATYLQQSSATATYLQSSSATATYLTQSSATITYDNIPVKITDGLVMEFDWENTATVCTNTVTAYEAIKATLTAGAYVREDFCGDMNAVYFDADNDYVVARGDTVYLALYSSWTTVVWLYANNGGEEGSGYIWGKQAGGPSGGEMNLAGLSRNSAKLSSYLYHVGADPYFISSDYVFQVQKLQMVALEYHLFKSSPSLSYWIDNRSIYAGTWTLGDAGTEQGEDSANPWYIGSNHNQARVWGGFIGVFRVYNRKLSTTELEMLRRYDVWYYNLSSPVLGGD